MDDQVSKLALSLKAGKLTIFMLMGMSMPVHLIGRRTGRSENPMFAI